MKGCFKKSFGCQGDGAEGIQSRNEKPGRPEVLSYGPDSWGSRGQSSQWEAELLFCYFKGRMFTGRWRKKRDAISLPVWHFIVCQGNTEHVRFGRVEEGASPVETPGMELGTLLHNCWQGWVVLSSSHSSMRSGPGPESRTLWWSLGDMCMGRLCQDWDPRGWSGACCLLWSLLSWSSSPRCVSGRWFESWACYHLPWWARLAVRMRKPTDTHCPSVSLPFQICRPRPWGLPPTYLVSLSIISSLAHTPRTSVTLWPASCCCSYSLPFLPLRWTAGRMFFWKCWSGSITLLLGRLAFNLKIKFKPINRSAKAVWVLFC